MWTFPRMSSDVSKSQALAGAGKSTLVNLILRYYDPQAGAVQANGRPLPEWSLRDFVRRVGVVTQDLGRPRANE